MLGSGKGAALSARADNELIRTVSQAGGFAVRVLVATGVVAEAALRHRTAPTASAALGRTLMGAILLAAGTQDGETVQLRLSGQGPVGAITAIADGRGRVRGYVRNGKAHPPLKDGKLDVGGALGRGILAVVRYHPSWREPYRGIVPLVSGEVAQDIAHYLVDSEQTPSAVALGVYVGPEGLVQAAGGFLVQALPGASESDLAELDASVKALPTPTEMVRAGLGADEILDRLLSRLGSRERHRNEPRFLCPCDRERMRQAVVLLGREETRDIAERGETLEIRCEFCGERYVLEPDEVGALHPDA